MILRTNENRPWYVQLHKMHGEGPRVDAARLIKGTRGITKGVRRRRGVLVIINFQGGHNRAKRML